MLRALGVWVLGVLGSEYLGYVCLQSGCSGSGTSGFSDLGVGGLSVGGLCAWSLGAQSPGGLGIWDLCAWGPVGLGAQGLGAGAAECTGSWHVHPGQMGSRVCGAYGELGTWGLGTAGFGITRLLVCCPWATREAFWGSVTAGSSDTAARGAP